MHSKFNIRPLPRQSRAAHISRTNNSLSKNSKDQFYTWSIELFYVGTHTDGYGATRAWDIEAMKGVVKNYGRRTRDDWAPIILGHHTDINAVPAFGVVEKLYIQGSSLMARITDIPGVFVEWVRSKFYRGWSAGLIQYEDGTWDLDHIAFLGAASPALKELRMDGLPIPKGSINKRRSRRNELKIFHHGDFVMDEQLINDLTNAIANIQAALQKIATETGVDISGILGASEEPGTEEEVVEEEFSNEDDDEDEDDESLNSSQDSDVEDEIDIDVEDEDSEQDREIRELREEIDKLKRSMNSDKIKGFFSKREVRERLTKEQVVRFSKIAGRSPEAFKEVKNIIKSMPVRSNLKAAFATDDRSDIGRTVNGRKSPEQEAREILNQKI